MLKLQISSFTKGFKFIIHIFNTSLRRVMFDITRPRNYGSVVTHRLGSGTGSGYKYRESVLEVRQGAMLNLLLPRMRRTVWIPVARGLKCDKGFDKWCKFPVPLA